MCLLHLTENLRLSDHQGIESGGDAEQVPGDFEIGDVIHVRLQRLAIDAVEVGDEVDQRHPPAIDVVAGAVEFRAVAGREHHRFAQRFSPAERPEGGLDPTRLKVDALAQFDRRRPMTDSDQDQMHDC
jgi:hypothetical protein